MVHPNGSSTGPSLRLMEVDTCTVLHVDRAVDLIDPTPSDEVLMCSVLAHPKYLDQDAIEDALWDLPPVRIHWRYHDLLELACTDIGRAFDHQGGVAMWCNHEPLNASFLQSRLPIDEETGLAVVEDCPSTVEATFRMRVAERMEAVYEIWQQTPDDAEKRLGSSQVLDMR
jgi:hypothetical protein